MQNDLTTLEVEFNHSKHNLLIATNGVLYPIISQLI